MIEFISGTLHELTPTYAVVTTGGIGFHLPVPLSSHSALPTPGSEVTLLTHLVVREDDMTLYGFATEEERSLFRLLIQVNGIGPKIGLTALSGMSPQAFSQAVSDGDTKRLSSISGIGKKMAERLVVELRDKLKSTSGPGTDGAVAGHGTPPTVRDAVLALIALGYKQQEARKLLDKALKNTDGDMPVEELVRLALGGA